MSWIKDVPGGVQKDLEKTPTLALKEEANLGFLAQGKPPVQCYYPAQSFPKPGGPVFPSFSLSVHLETAVLALALTDAAPIPHLFPCALSVQLPVLCCMSIQPGFWTIMLMARVSQYKPHSELGSEGVSNL